MCDCVLLFCFLQHFRLLIRADMDMQDADADADAESDRRMAQQLQQAEDAPESFAEEDHVGLELGVFLLSVLCACVSVLVSVVFRKFADFPKSFMCQFCFFSRCRTFLPLKFVSQMKWKTTSTRTQPKQHQHQHQRPKRNRLQNQQNQNEQQQQHRRSEAKANEQTGSWMLILLVIRANS